MNQDRAEVETCADQYADDLVTEVERYEVPITRGEAPWRLLSAVAIIRAPAYAIDDGGEPKPIEPAQGPSGVGPPRSCRAGGSRSGPLCGAGLPSGRPGDLHYRHPLPASTTGIAIPWGVATELGMRLSAVLVAGSTLDTSLMGFAAPEDLAPPIVRLSSRVAEEIAWVGDDDIVDDTKVNGRRYLPATPSCGSWTHGSTQPISSRIWQANESFRRSRGLRPSPKVP